MFENFESTETAEIVPPLPYFALFETKKEMSLNESQRKVIVEYISQTSENFHLISAYFKGFGTADAGTETLLIRACQKCDGKYKSLSKIMSSYWKRAKTASPALLESLLDVAERESSLEARELLVTMYITMSSEKQPPTQKLVDMILALCQTLVDQSRGEEKNEDDWPEFELPEVDPEEGTLENLFDNESLQESAPKRMRSVKNLVSFLSPKIDFNQAQLKSIVSIGRAIQDLDPMIGWRAVQSQCIKLLFVLVAKLGHEKFAEILDADNGVDTDSAFDLGLLCRYVYHSVLTGNVSWLNDFVIGQIRALANSEVEKVGQWIDHFFVIMVIMIDHACELKQVISSLFLNLCSATTVSSTLTLKLLSFFNYLISKRSEDTKQKVFPILEEFLPIACGSSTAITLKLFDSELPADDALCERKGQKMIT